MILHRSPSSPYHARRIYVVAVQQKERQECRGKRGSGLLDCLAAEARLVAELTFISFHFDMLACSLYVAVLCSMYASAWCGIHIFVELVHHGFFSNRLSDATYVRATSCSIVSTSPILSPDAPSPKADDVNSTRRQELTLEELPEERRASLGNDTIRLQTLPRVFAEASFIHA